MKVYQTNEIRNISLLGNSGSKNHSRRAMRFRGGAIKRRELLKERTLLPIIFQNKSMVTLFFLRWFCRMVGVKS